MGMSDPAPPFRLPAFLPYRLSITANLVSDVIATAYQALFGLSIVEWRVVAIVAQQGSATQQEVCELSRMEKVAVSRAAIALCERRLMERRPHPQDRRSHLLALTATGRALFDQVIPKALELEARLFQDFSAQERHTLEGLLARIDAAALRHR